MIVIIQKIFTTVQVKIIGILAVAFILASALSQTVFLANTPRINRPFFAGLVNLPGTIKDNGTNFIASLFTNQLSPSEQQKIINTFNSLPATTSKQLAPGVYAKTDSKDNVVYIKVSPGTQYDEKTINYNGQQIQVRFPKGTFK